jgi:hypothetical protein
VVSCQHSVGVGLVRMGSADEVHRDIRVGQNQEWVPALHPVSISASVRSISAEGKACRRAGRTNHFELLPYSNARFTSARQVESLADPLGNGPYRGDLRSISC